MACCPSVRWIFIFYYYNFFFPAPSAVPSRPVAAAADRKIKERTLTLCARIFRTCI